MVDPGPESCLETLLDGLADEPRALLLTHIHLDHAGAAGALCRRYPQLTVYVHESGAPHLADPTKLLKSAARLYGDDMERLWGEVAPVPAGADPDARRRGDGGGDAGGLHAGPRLAPRVLPARGDRRRLRGRHGRGAAARLGPYTVAPTPPPDIDVEAWLDSVDTIEEWGADALCLTHFGTLRRRVGPAGEGARGAARGGGARPGARPRRSSRPGRRRGPARRSTRRRPTPACRPRRPTSSGWACGATGRSERRWPRERRPPSSAPHRRARAAASAATGA